MVISYFTLLAVVLVLLARVDTQKTLTGDDDEKITTLKLRMMALKV